LSIPHVTLVEIDAVRAQQLAVFLLKRASPMVLLLRFGVLQHGLELTWTHRKRTIATLPEEAAIVSVKRFDPFRGCFLYLLDELSLGKSPESESRFQRWRAFFVSRILGRFPRLVVVKPRLWR
jgi:hypothetical protein